MPKALVGEGGTEAKAEPIPAWAVEAIQNMTPKNLKTLKARLLKGGLA